MGRFLARLVSFVLITAVASAAVGLWGYAQFTKPGPLSVATSVVIPSGVGLDGIAEALHRVGAIEQERIFVVGARVMGAGRELRAGEFQLPERASPREIIDILREGKTVVRRVTIAEGLTVAEVMRRLDAADGLTGTVDPPPPEGSLLPETYHFSFGDARADLVARMRRAMSDTLDELWAERSPDLPFETKEEALVLASIIERETGVDEERALVGGVFVNRLRRGMRLQSDPTVAYGIAPAGLDRSLTRADLKSETAFNTYVISGLPPSPIANPGRASIRAAVRPADTDFLYFVADGEGGHAFARTLTEHNANVARWRRIQRRSSD